MFHVSFQHCYMTVSFKLFTSKISAGSPPKYTGLMSEINDESEDLFGTNGSCSKTQTPRKEFSNRSCAPSSACITRHNSFKNMCIFMLGDNTETVERGRMAVSNKRSGCSSTITTESIYNDVVSDTDEHDIQLKARSKQLNIRQSSRVPLATRECL